MIARSFEATVEQLYEMWTNPEHLMQWLPPEGATMRFIRAEPRLTGTSFYEMTFTGGEPMYGLIRYLELNRPSRIVYVQQFCDANETVIRPPFFPHWPLHMKTVVGFVAESEDTTRVTIRWEPMDAQPEDIAEFIQQRPSMTGGWCGSLDKLAL